MRPEITTTIPENPHVHLANEANNNLNILDVVIMMRMTFASFMQFGKVDKSMI